jgi:hypothetical protein
MRDVALRQTIFEELCFEELCFEELCFEELWPKWPLIPQRFTLGRDTRVSRVNRDPDPGLVKRYGYLSAALPNTVKPIAP